MSRDRTRIPAATPDGLALADREALCNPHRVCSRLVDIAEDKRSTEPTTGDMLSPKVSHISAGTAHSIKADASRTGVPYPVSR
jgi:hypothetical protein